MTWSASASNRSALRWQWLVDQPHRSRRRRSGPARFDVEAREERLRRCHAARLARVGSPRRARRGSAGRRCRPHRTGRRARAGRGGAARSPAGTARPRGRPAGTPRRGRRGRRAAASPAAVVARLRRPWPGPTAAPRRRPCWRCRRTSHSAASASWSRQPSSRVAVGARASSAQAAPSADSAVGRGVGPLPVEVAVGHRDGPVDEVAEVVGEVGVVAADERVPATPRRRGRTAPRAGRRSGRRPGPNAATKSSGSRKLPRLLLIRSPPAASSKPWTQTWRGASSPALHSIAGQKIVWKRAMSLPMTCRSAGHQCANASGSSGKPAPVM